MSARSGQLGLNLFDDRFVQDPYPLYDRMRACGPVHPVGDSGFYAVCTWDAVNEVIARPEDFSSNLTATMTYQDGKRRNVSDGRTRRGHSSARNCR